MRDHLGMAHHQVMMKTTIWIWGLAVGLGASACAHAPAPLPSQEAQPVFYRGNYITRWDVAYGDHERQVMDIHLRGEWADPDDRLNIRMEGPQPPTVVFAHGSAWYISDKRQWEHFISPFLQAGFNVINLNYRLRVGIAPALEDVRKALVYLAEHNEKLKLDLQHVFLAGTSAGGFMSMFHGAAQNSDRPRDRLPSGLRVAGVINIVGGGTGCYGLYKHLVGHKHPFWQKVGRSLVADHARAEELMAEVCPSQHFDAGDPPVFLAHGERDEFGPPERYRDIEARLRGHGTVVERVGYPNSGHTFIQRDWEDLFPRVIAFIKRHSAPVEAAAAEQR